MPIRVAVPKEAQPGERRVALVPEVAGRLVKGGHEVRLEPGAGAGSYYPDAEYSAQGVSLGDAAGLYRGVEVVVGVQPPSTDAIGRMGPGTVVIGLMNPARNLEGVARMRDARLTVFALELLPRITRAQSMDVLSSQATVAGYRAALLAAEHVPRLLPMLTTAAGTIRPARVLVLGAGVAGLMAIATARRLGAQVEAYDVRRAAGEQVRSLGAKFLELAINAEGQGGYARELTDEEKALERKMVADAVAQADAIVTTAAIPGRPAPKLVSREMVARMKPGAVLVDLAAETGGNCELTRPGETVRANGATIVGPLNLPSQAAYHASQMFAKNVQSFLALLIDPNGKLVREYSDEILAASLLVADGEVKHGPTREALEKRKP
jgi:NAD(P) transhydrogenase subunit alpha